ncbi:TetR/AcrR family transcriptional regulator [Rhizohabitans arisaemae]|uniref:TetR/AcrR family transcriptional regulator n=1 Tax=Rhizohabitans arisaemae TaxID=2720610 RepID=UPI0024B22B9F|nr:TetR/AcrR family transcriptional regulator [Rhizohabitans arisaemae]
MGPGTTPKLPRAQRREQIIAAAIPMFARSGHAGTSLDDVAVAAGISRMIIYRHFESKDDLYRAAIRHAARHLDAAVGGELTEGSVRAMVSWASADPDAFRLLFHQAAREPQFRQDVDELRGEMAEEVHRNLAGVIDDPLWARWAAQLSLTVTIEAIMAWLDIGRPAPDRAHVRIERAVDAVLRSLQD